MSLARTEDTFGHVVSFSSPSRVRSLYAKANFPADHKWNREKFIAGDISTSIIKTALGRTIMRRGSGFRLVVFGATPDDDGLRRTGAVAVTQMAALLPYALEMTALRRMPMSAFGILMSLEPALGALAGFLVLTQPMTPLQMLGTGLVVAASAGVTTSGSGES